VRAHGVVGEVPAAGPADHLCWVYEDGPEFDGAVAQFAAGGLDRGERLLLVGERIVESLHTRRDDVDALIARGALETRTLDGAYDSTTEFAPDEQLAFYQAEIRRAHADGFTGLRVVAEVSALADDEHRAALVRWEHVADDFAASGSGFSAMCAYRADLGTEALSDVAAVHPLVHAHDGVPPFRVFVDDHRIALAGSIDTFGAGRLSRVLASSAVRPPTAVLDLGAVDFVDVAACRTLAGWARGLAQRSIRLEVVGASALTRRMWHVLGLDSVATVAFREAGA
jgi:anti-anti-sigma factor